MVLDGAAVALLGAEGVGNGYSQRDSETGEKRSKLRRYEHVGPQVLNVAGVSPIHECSNKALWSTTAKGNKSVAFYSVSALMMPIARALLGVAMQRLCLHWEWFSNMRFGQRF